MHRISGWLAAGFGAVALLSAGTASANSWGFSAYGGWNGSLNSDVQFTGPGTDWTVHSVPWDGVSFAKDGGAPYYGVRITYWPSAIPDWGFAIDYNHAKVRAQRTATVNYSGTLNGGAFNGSDQVQNLFDVLEFTDGFSLVTLNALHKLPAYGMFHFYVGAGVGVSIPHVEVTGNGGSVPFARTFQYEFGGPAAQALVGVDVPLTSRISLFGEYKLSWTSFKSPMNGGYKIETTLITNHLLAGATLHFGR